MTFDLWHTYQTAAKLMFIKLLIFDHKTNNALTENQQCIDRKPQYGHKINQA